MKNNLEKLRMAANHYRLKNDNQLTENVLVYIEQRIQANQHEIEELIRLKKETVMYSKIHEMIKHEMEEDVKYKAYKQLEVNEQKFISTSLLMPIGVVAVEAYDTIEVVKYIIRAIKTRNAIAISDAEYDEQSVKFLILEIIKEGLKKFEIDENLIMILPYEECFYSYFDKVIYTYNKQGKHLRQNGYEKKKATNKKYIYIENEELKEIGLQDNRDEEKEIIQGSVKEAIEKINEVPAMAAAIYTKDAEKAYHFINLVNSQNILVNTSLDNAKEAEKSQYELYEYRNILLPMPKTEKKEEYLEIEKETKQETSLQVVNKTIFEKIKDFLKKFFQK